MINELMSTMSLSLITFLTLVAHAFAKIVLMLLGVIIAFLAIPRSRVAAMMGIAVISSFAGGILIELSSTQGNWTNAFAMSVAFGAGFAVFPVLTFFKKFNEVVNQDQELVEIIFQAIKNVLKKLLKTVDKPKKKS